MNHITHHVRVQTRIVAVLLVFRQPSSQSGGLCRLLRLRLLYDAQKLQLSGTWLNIIKQYLPISP
jgi:hypothetical protein